MRAIAATTLVLAVSNCTAHPQAATGKEARLESCRYDVAVAKARPLTLDVTAECAGRGFAAFSANEPELLPHLREVRDLEGRLLQRDGARYRLPDSGRAGLRYRVDLDAIAASAQSFDVALRSGDTLIAPVSTWLLRPEPPGADTRVLVSVRSLPGVDFATGLTPAGEGFELGAHEIRVGTYSAFGTLARSRVELPGPLALDEASATRARIEVVVADGPLDVERAALERWIVDSATAVARFWRGFPVPRALLVVLPVTGRSGVSFGKVLPESAPGIVVMVGERSDRAALSRDWILVHELFHLGFPSFVAEGKWLDEGLATYYEPIIRARAGMKTEEAVWEEFTRAMPQGLPALTGAGLDGATEYREVYWGGALVCLLADVEARRRTRGRTGLEHGLVEVLRRGGHASEVWSLSDTIATIDGALKAPILAELARRYGQRGGPVDLAALWRALGVRRVDGGVQLRDDAPLAHVRRAIVAGVP